MADESDFLRKKPQQSRSRQVVDSILQAADELLARSDNPDALSLQGIARRAGVGIGSLYDYFANREGLLGAFLARLSQTNFEQLERQVAGTQGLSFDEALPHLVDAALRMYLERPQRTRSVILAIGRVGLVKPVVRERDRFAGVLAQRLRADHPELGAQKAQLVSEVLCDCVIGVVLGELWRERDARGAAEVRDEVVQLVRLRLAALRAPAP